MLQFKHNKMKLQNHVFCIKGVLYEIINKY